ncbi:MAG: hypothetical protein GY750_08160 [Lentisphaerae bacterium]|nr:hypothetical protein [Lentisphaerota bacterium]MCP4101382.1 hypothetical protein [Lentisphaerota bacterium]
MTKLIIKQPPKVKNCATCTFMCSALELGIQKFPISFYNGNANRPWEKISLKTRKFPIDKKIIERLKKGYYKSSNFTLKNTDNILIDSIYAFMTNSERLKYISHSSELQEYPIKNRGEVLPSGILNYIDFLNNNSKTKFNYEVCIIPKFLEWYYPDEYKLMFKKANIQRFAPPKLKKNERMMVLVSIENFKFKPVYDYITCKKEPKQNFTSHNLHWIMYRPDGSYMDPGTGKNYSSFWDYNNSRFCKSLKSASLSGRFDLGVYIIIKSKDRIL